MKRLIIILFALTSLVACKNTSNDPEAIQAEISKKKMEIMKLQTEIHDLEKQLKEQGLTSGTRNILVHAIKVKPQRFVHNLDVTGNVETELEAFISPEINGLIENILVQEGDYVKSGQLLATINTDIIEMNIREVSTQLSMARTVYKKQKELWDQNIGSEIQYLQAKTNMEALEKKLDALKTQLSKADIRAPFDGYIEKIYQKLGEIGNPARNLFHLVNLSKLKVTANISETHLPYIKKGDTATISFAIYPDVVLHEPISVVGSVINPANRTFEIQIKIPNNDRLFRPNIIATVQISDHVFDSAIVVPSIIVKNDAQGNNYVYVVGESGGEKVAQKRYITAGLSYGNKTMVVKGLEPGDQLIVQGYNLVKNGSTIRLKEEN
jgi:RND family efflux transporter MFP subunit